jgi:hypothetical protein
VLQASHQLIAMRNQQPHWLLSDADAKTYAVAWQNAMRHIPIRVQQKYIDFTALAFAIGQFEFPRIMLSAQIARQQARRASPGAAPVFQFRPADPGPSSAPAGQGTAPGGAAPPNGAANGRAQGPAADMTYEPEPDTPRFGP